jgi:hemerythrin-like metal-binding protein/PAS domain S-box-containing protein
MKTFIHNLKIRTKVLIGFGIISLLLILIVIRDRSLLRFFQNHKQDAIENIKMAKSVKTSGYYVRSEMQTSLSLISADGTKIINDWWAEHQANSKKLAEEFLVLGDFVKNSTNPSFDVHKERLLKNISDIEDTYKKVIIPSFEKIYQLKTEKLDAATAEGLALDTVQSLDAVMNMNLDVSAGNQSATEAVISEMKQLATYIDVTGLEMIKKLDETDKVVSSVIVEIEKEAQDRYSKSQVWSLIYIVLGILISIFTSLFFANFATASIHKLRDLVRLLSKGELSHALENHSNDEVGEMTQAFNELINGLRRTAEFSTEIGKGNFSSEFTPMSENDVLGNSLLTMRRSLQEAKIEEEKRKIEDEQRNWATEGLAKFGEILRHSDNIQILSDDIISNLVKYLKANQGGIFIYNDSVKDKEYLELTASYAYNRKKYINRKIKPGEGLIGSCLVEKYTIFMTDVPDDYVEIESGLGTSNPKSILIVPLKTEDNVLGVIEIASFKTFEKHEIDLIEKITESIALTLQTLKINARTSELLLQSQLQTEEMHKQEELMIKRMEQLRTAQQDAAKREDELRRNMEELSRVQSTLVRKDQEQEQMIRKLNEENEKKEKAIALQDRHSRMILETSLDGVIIIDDKGIVQFFNDSASRMFLFDPQEVVGKNVSVLMKSEHSASHDKYMKDYLTTGLKKIIGIGREVEFLRKDGTTGAMFLSVIENKIEDQTFFTGFVRDLSDFKMLEQKRSELLESMMVNELKYRTKVEQLEAALLNKQGMEDFGNTGEHELLAWSNDLSIDIEVIDEQHKKWIELVNSLFKAVSLGHHSSEVLRVFDDFVQFTNYHFSFEEKYFEEFSYPKMVSHSFEHQTFVDKLVELESNWKEGRTEAPIQFLQLLKSWIVQHILLADKAFVKTFKDNGVS